MGTAGSDAMALRHSLLRERLDQGKPVHCFKSNLASLLVPHLLGTSGIDCLWLDREHLPTDTLTAYGLIQMAHLADTDAVVRVPNGQLADAAVMLDAGADGIMYPRATTVEEVKALARALRFPPLGVRGLDIVSAANDYGQSPREQFVSHADRNVIIILQIETPEALEHLDAMAAVKGLDILFIGLGDLALALDVPLDPNHPKLRSAVDRTVAAANANGLGWGGFVQDGDHARQLLSRGALFLAAGSDTRALNDAARSVIEQMKKIGVPFGRA